MRVPRLRRGQQAIDALDRQTGGGHDLVAEGPRELAPFENVAG